MSFLVTPRQFLHRAEFYQQLAQLTAAGLGVVSGLEQLKRHPPSRSFREPIQHLLDRLEQGRTLADALKSPEPWLPEFDVALIDAGERSGRLDGCFRLLAHYYNDQARLRKQMISQMLYPVGLVHMAALVFWVVLPFARSQFHDSLSLLLLKAALALAPLYLVTAVILFATQSRHGERWRGLIESLLHWIPLLGAAHKALALARLSAALEALISAGVTILPAWDLAANACGSPAMRRVVASLQPGMIAGQTPAEAIRTRSHFPDLFTNLYSSGELSGKLDETLSRLYAHYQEEGTLKLQAFAQWLPRLLYGIVAAVIAYSIIQFWTGYFNQIATLTGGF
jgi:type II secretory pathway component PulF